jgi:lipopolysaccharide export system protein LptA
LKGGIAPTNEVYREVVGGVVLKQNQTAIYCDSAILYEKRNFIEAFGNVRITEGDSLTITGRKLEYYGDSKKAKLLGNVIFTKLETATLYTENLDYERQKSLAFYYDGGTLVDSINVLTSGKGYFNVNSNVASFKRNVVVQNPDYTMTSDSLQYNSNSKIIYFRSPTTIVNLDSTTFVYNSGNYDTKTKHSDLRFGTGESKNYEIESDNYQLDDIEKIYKLRGNVKLKAKNENLIIYGQASDYFKNKGVFKIYTNAYVAKVTESNDTLFITADTLISIENVDPIKKRLLAYHNVKIFKNGLQGISDSLEYRYSDSTIYLYQNPVLWPEGNQMSADSIRILIKSNTIEKILLNRNSFVISLDTLFNYNQIKGRKMTAEFRNKILNNVMVDGNAESAYFILEENKKDSTEAKTLGMNKIICSRITIRFKNGQVDNLSFYIKPDAKFIPPHELRGEDKKLQGFEWKIREKPQRENVVKQKVTSNK